MYILDSTLYLITVLPTFDSFFYSSMISRLKQASDEEKRAFESDDLRKRLIFDLVKKDPVKTRAEEKYAGFYKAILEIISNRSYFSQK